MMSASCSEEDTFAPANGTGRQICFTPTDDLQSRAGQRESLPADTFYLTDNANPGNNLRCTSETSPMDSQLSRATATTSPASVSEIGVIAHASWHAPLLMDNDLYKRDASGVYKSQDIRYWPGDASATLDFYAFTPYSPDGLTLPQTKSSTTLSYTVPADASLQTDLMLATNKGVAGNYNQAVALTFSHLLAGVRVRFHETPEGWSIKSVNFKNIHLSGTLDFAAGDPLWTMTDASTASATASGVTSEAIFMVLPQTGDIDLEIVMSDGTGDRIYSRRLAGEQLSMGNITTYSISVTDYNFEIDRNDPIDAHYVIYNTTLKADGVASGTDWTVTVSADGADTSLQLTADVNDYVKQGFWTDRLIENNADKGSARGSNEMKFSGSSDYPITVFVPENADGTEREVTLTITVKGKVQKEIKLTQLYPAWTTSGFGWEQIDDKTTAEYGFKWDRVLYYGYLYANKRAVIEKNYNYLQSIIEDNKATGFASIHEYSYNILYTRYAIKIDYRLLNSLSGITDHTNELSNTTNLYNHAGAATTNSFANIVASIKKTENGKETEPAFRLGNGNTGEAPAPSGSNINGSPAIGDCLKKNRYNLQRSINSEGDVSLSPVIKADDIVWYMPAVGQFSLMPSTVVDPIMPADCWSSTAVTNGTDAYLGDGTISQRLVNHKVRAARNRP